MSNWLALTDNAWSFSRTVITGYGGGIGNYQTAYAIDKEPGKFLNGKITANLRLAPSSLTGAGVLCRGSKSYSFVALYLSTDDKKPDALSLRLSAFKEGILKSIVAHRQTLTAADRTINLSLQFFSGVMTAFASFGEDTRIFEYLMPHIPFPGYCGVVKFYGSGVTFKKVQIERIDMRPKLKEDLHKAATFAYDIFISHASKDKEIVKGIVHALRKAGISYWIDHEQITFGDPIVRRIEEGLEKSRFVLVCLSENLGQSNWCRAEYGPILYREFSGFTGRKAIPLKIDDSSDTKIPLLLSDKMRAVYGDKSQFNALLEFLKNARVDVGFSL